MGGLSFNMFTWSVLFDGHVLVPSCCLLLSLSLSSFQRVYRIFSVSYVFVFSSLDGKRHPDEKAKFLDVRGSNPYASDLFIFIFFVIVLQLFTLVVQFSHNTGNISPL